MNVLITTVDMSMPGGVAWYFSALRPLLPQHVEYFTIGARANEKSIADSILRNIRDYKEFNRILAKRQYDLVMVNPSLMWKSLLRDAASIFTAKRKGIPVIVFMHGWDQRMEKSICSWLLPVFKKIYFQADGFIVLAKQFKTILRGIGYPGPIYCETTIGCLDSIKDKTEIIKRGQDCDEAIRMLFIGRLDKGKGAEEAIKAFAYLKNRYKRLFLTIAGDGPLLLSLKNLANQLKIGDITFPGFVRGEEKDNVFAHSDILVFPSHSEGMPNVVLEAMAWGLPVVTRPVGGLRDFFENGKMGLTTESKDPIIIAEHIEHLIQRPDLRAKMGAYNAKYSWEKFRASVVAQRLILIMEDMVYRESNEKPVKNNYKAWKALT
jgi:glycosyltransferase involved in cell wall biosynthesis